MLLIRDRLSDILLIWEVDAFPITAYLSNNGSKWHSRPISSKKKFTSDCFCNSWEENHHITIFDDWYINYLYLVQVNTTWIYLKVETGLASLKM